MYNDINTHFVTRLGEIFMEVELLSRLNPQKAAAWRSLLTQTGLTPDEDRDVVCLVWQEGELVATGSRKENILKHIAVSPLHQGEDLTATVLTALRQDAFSQGYRHLFLYTKPQNKFLFSSLFFYPIAQTGQVLLMEDRRGGIEEFLSALPVPEGEGIRGAVVMNCNPFTKGHRYLIETAAKECDHLFAFVLSEDKSRFSAHDRMEMVKLGTKDLPNVSVLPTGPYLISAATFPTYFLKDRDKAPLAQCELDVEIFLRYYAPHFGITRRYVGTEPLSPLTNAYNEALRSALPPRGVEFREIPRLETAGEPISASGLRKALEEENWDKVRQFAPESTVDYLKIWARSEGI